jgi:RNA polymerase sigma-70 factor (ECF subfamily)
MSGGHLGRAGREPGATAIAGATSEVREHELVVRARGGDGAAFDELVREHAPRVYRMLVRVIGNPTSAEDVAQESFARAWRGLSGFREDARFSTWLYRIAMNEANRFLEREARCETLPHEDVMQEVPDLAADTIAGAESRELRRELERYLAELPGNYRAAVVLRDVEGLTNEEAAEVLGLRVRNFKSRLHRGRMELRRRLEEAARER